MKIQILFLFLFTLVFPLNAYIDPGTGSFIFQIIIAGLAGALYTLKIFWKQIVSFFGRIFGRK